MTASKKYSSKISYGLLILIFVVFYAPLIPDLIKNGWTTEILAVTGFFFYMDPNQISLNRVILIFENEKL